MQQPVTLASDSERVDEARHFIGCSTSGSLVDTRDLA